MAEILQASKFCMVINLKLYYCQIPSCNTCPSITTKEPISGSKTNNSVVIQVASRKVQWITNNTRPSVRRMSHIERTLGTSLQWANFVRSPVSRRLSLAIIVASLQHKLDAMLRLNAGVAFHPGADNESYHFESACKEN
jgi:hypothetical protein